MSYKKLEIWKLARELAIQIHQLTLSELPNFEKFEEGSQIRRSSKSISANIVEGYGRRKYKQEFVKFLIYALASCDETTEHLEILFETSSLKNRFLFEELHSKLQTLGRKLNLFLQSVEKSHVTPKVGLIVQDSLSSIKYPASRIKKSSVPSV